MRRGAALSELIRLSSSSELIRFPPTYDYLYCFKHIILMSGREREVQRIASMRKTEKEYRSRVVSRLEGEGPLLHS